MLDTPIGSISGLIGYSAGSSLTPVTVVQGSIFWRKMGMGMERGEGKLEDPEFLPSLLLLLHED